MFQSRTHNNRINLLNIKALRIVYLNFNKLFKKHESFKIHHKNILILAIDVFFEWTVLTNYE